MPKVISKYPLDLSGRSPTNLVPGEKQLLLSRGTTPFRVVSFSQGGFYSASLKVYNKDFKLLKPNVDYVATYKHVDASAYTGLEICSAVVILNHTLTSHVLVGGQMVGSDFAFSLTVEDDTITYLNGLAPGAVPLWAGYVGDEPQWQPGQLQEERWERHHYGNLNAAVERLTGSITSGNGVAEHTERANIRLRYQEFIDRFQNQIAAHINNQLNPHQLDKTHIGLDQLQNYPIANTTVAKAGTSAAHYLTTRGVFDILDQFGNLPLDNHIAAKYTTHSPTAAQLNTYLKAALDVRLNAKLPLLGTAVGANGIMGKTSANPGSVVDLTQLSAYNEMRLNLDASKFTVNRVAPARLGINPPTAGKFLASTGEWVLFSDIYIFYTAGGGAEIYWAGNQGDVTTGLANIRTTFADWNAYPWGTVVIFYVLNTETWHYGNGGNVGRNYWSFRAAFRTQTDWFVLG